MRNKLGYRRIYGSERMSLLGFRLASWLLLCTPAMGKTPTRGNIHQIQHAGDIPLPAPGTAQQRSTSVADPPQSPPAHCSAAGVAA